MLLVYIRRKRFSDEILNGIYLEFKKLILKLFIYRLNKMGESILFCIKLRLLLKKLFKCLLEVIYVLIFLYNFFIICRSFFWILIFDNFI